ncbi:MAG: tetratricopeptide repeat protein [Candidatus Magnetomorum sp.]|nr:tetratricopeptide repeat protein [Candidatus Magnetomorum sp.]
MIKKNIFKIAFIVMTIFMVPTVILADSSLDQIRTLLEKRQLKEALKQVDTFLGANQKQPEALFLRGLILFESGRIDESIDVFKLLTQEYPLKPELYNNLAVSYAVKGDYYHARDALKKAIEIYPGYTKAHENLGDIYMNIARQSYEKALQLDPDKKSIHKKLNHINNLPIMQGNPNKTTSANEQSHQREVRKPAQVRATIPKPTPILNPPASIPQKIQAENIARAEAQKMVQNVMQEEVQKLGHQDTHKEKPSMASHMDNVQTEKSPCSTWDSHPELKVIEENALTTALKTWASVWSRKDLKAYLSMYAPSFKPPHNLSRKSWERQRKQRLNKDYINVTIANPQITFVTCALSRVTFDQFYSSGSYEDHSKKLILFKKVGPDWRIIKESAVSR